MDPKTLAPSQDDLKITEELALLTRGFFSLPVMSALGRLGVLAEMASKPAFGVADFPKAADQKLLEITFRYLSRLGFLEIADSQGVSWKITELGRQVIQRVTSFYVPHSYHEYMETYFDRLQGLERKPSVDRLENIIGSGRTHQRYFPYAVSFLKRRVAFDLIADIGCGDGYFLDTVLSSIPGKDAAGIDLSEISIQATGDKLQRKYPDRKIKTIGSDAGDVRKWGTQLLTFCEGRIPALSMWFLIHEISNYDSKKIAAFISQIHELFPKSPLVIGEIVRQQDSVLACTRKDTLMPEYLFFHDMSGQGVLSWKEYQDLLANVPYQLASERLFDESEDATGLRQPSSFIWCLIPK